MPRQYGSLYGDYEQYIQALYEYDKLSLEELRAVKASLYQDLADHSDQRKALRGQLQALRTDVDRHSASYRSERPLFDKYGRINLIHWPSIRQWQIAQIKLQDQVEAVSVRLNNARSAQDVLQARLLAVDEMIQHKEGDEGRIFPEGLSPKEHRRCLTSEWEPSTYLANIYDLLDQGLELSYRDLAYLAYTVLTVEWDGERDPWSFGKERLWSLCKTTAFQVWGDEGRAIRVYKALTHEEIHERLSSSLNPFERAINFEITKVRLKLFVKEGLSPKPSVYARRSMQDEERRQVERRAARHYRNRFRREWHRLRSHLVGEGWICIRRDKKTANDGSPHIIERIQPGIRYQLQSDSPLPVIDEATF